MEGEFDEGRIDAAVEFLDRYGFLESVADEARSETGASLGEALIAILRSVESVADKAGLSSVELLRLLSGNR